MPSNPKKRFRSDSSLESWEDLLECSLCFHEFDEGDLKPKFLTCSHTFCLKCLHTLTSSLKIVCPMCRAITQASKGVASLPTNNYILHLLRTSNSTDVAILVSKCEEKDSKILELQQLNQSLEIRNQELEEKLKQLESEKAPVKQECSSSSTLHPNPGPSRELEAPKKLVIKIVAANGANNPAPTQTDDIDNFIRHFRSQLKKMGLIYNDVVTWGSNKHPELSSRLLTTFMTRRMNEEQSRKWIAIFQNFLADMTIEQPVIRLQPLVKNQLFPKRVLDALEQFFKTNSSPHLSSIVELAKKLRMPTQRVDAWFAQRRLAESAVQ